MIKNKPQVRFSENLGDWECSKAATIFASISDKNHSDLPVLSATQEFGMVRRDEINYDISYDKNNKATYKRVMPGQFTIHLRSFQGGFAHCAIDGITSPAYTIMDFKEKARHDDYFWKYVFSSDAFIKRLNTVTYGIRDGRSISFDDFKSLLLSYPAFEEQVKIGITFQKISKLITHRLYQYEKVRNLKKALLRKMFPKDSSAIPEIRFSGFDGAWTMRKVGDFIEDYTEKTTVRNQYPVLTSSQQKGIVFQEDYFGNRQVTTDENIGYYVLPKGYFTYRSRSDNSVFIFNRNDLIDKGIISYFYPVFKVSGADSDFFLRRLNHGIEHQIAIAAEGTGQHVLSLKKFKNMNALFPKDDEQCKIGSFFKLIDQQITNLQHELEKLNNIRKYLLERMLV